MTLFSRPISFRHKAFRSMTRPIMLAAAALILAACSTHPLGMSKEEWVLLTPEQQMAARMKQADLNRAHAERRTEQAAARRQRFAALEVAERRRIEELYRSTRYGDVLECVVEGGVADFRRGWRSYTPVPFTLARGEIKSVKFSGGDRRGKFWAKYSADGLSMKLCYGKPKGRGGRFCASINGQSQDFSSGINREVSIKKVFRNARVVCAHRPEHDMPEVYVRRHNTRVYHVIHNHHYRSRARRTPVVIHQHYSRPAPKHRTRTVIHKHYHDAPKKRRAHRHRERAEQENTRAHKKWKKHRKDKKRRARARERNAEDVLTTAPVSRRKGGRGKPDWRKDEDKPRGRSRAE